MSRYLITVTAVFVSCLFLTSCATVPKGSPETGYSIHGFVGTTSTQAAGGQTVLLLDGKTEQPLQSGEANFMGKYVFSGLQPGYYKLRAGEIDMDVVLGSDDKRLDIDMSAPGGAMNYAKIPPVPSGGTGGGTAAPAGPNDPELASQIAGTWWGYHGSTETKIGLCADGTYRDFTESGYSGSTADMDWGTASQGGGSGSWTIQGDGQSGTISVRYQDGSTKSIQYRQTGESGCLFFDGVKLCRTSDEC